ncbi:het-c domain containing protein [Grosmannia clavigera kw1407]|uniref:Het-c domain containing protein n=1 Tax=Grosmannia clavigera (strain kw1407 / UAMH 11150) TaxID=655863 RepID=F0XD66_GROCL|nr:het-c domain containing protein [Grosmannia clavigera kw1407]EFX03521.1 het-c domain containing protein [Grosmannia clavigera kw1407]
MASIKAGWSSLLILVLVLTFMPGRAAAFGAGNIPSIAQVEGHNWRHGDIEDMLKTIAFLHGKKWTTMLVQRTYFGNWLRDYSQAVDVGSLKGVNGATIRILVWVLSFLAFGYATEEFEVTEERLGCYRPEEHIDNPKGYADGEDARQYDSRLRGPIDPQELAIDPDTGMKNYIANERGGWATSAGYLRFSFARSIHFGRTYLHGQASGKEADLCEALRCLGQSLHCMEDFSAHSNYCELALIEMGYSEVFPHCGVNSQINLRGRRVYPIVTGTFGGVDFLHSVIGEANDHFTQSEVDEVDIALKNAEQLNRSGSLSGGGNGTRGLFGSSSGDRGDFMSLISQLPGVGGGFVAEASRLQSMAAAQEEENTRAAGNVNQVPGMSTNFDPVSTARKIYPILEFRDKIVRSINNTISKIPGLESLIEKISERLSAFVLGLLAPFIRPIINQCTKVLKDGSSGVISASANTQLEPWTDAQCTDPTHSMLSKDHFTNVLNSCAGRVAATVLQYAVPRILYAWDNPNVPVDEVANDIIRAFHHPAIRDDRIPIQQQMFETVRRWVGEYPRQHELNHLLSSQSVKTGKNHIVNGVSGGGSGSAVGGHSHAGGHSHGGGGGWQSTLGNLGNMGNMSNSQMANTIFSQFKSRDLDAMDGRSGNMSDNYMSTSPAPNQASSSSSPSQRRHHMDLLQAHPAVTVLVGEEEGATAEVMEVVEVVEGSMGQEGAARDITPEGFSKADTALEGQSEVDMEQLEAVDMVDMVEAEDTRQVAAVALSGLPDLQEDQALPTSSKAIMADRSSSSSRATATFTGDHLLGAATDRHHQCHLASATEVHRRCRRMAHHLLRDGDRRGIEGETRRKS